MAKNLYLNIDDDVNRIIQKISKEKASSLTLVLPKQAQLFFDIANLRALKEKTDQLGKDISILTMDPKGQQKALEVGFALRGIDYLQRGTRNMDVGPRSVSVSEKVAAVAGPAKAVIQHKFVDPLREVLSELPKVSYPKFPPASANSAVTVRSTKKVRQRRLVMFATFLGLFILFLLAFVVLPRAEVVISAEAVPVSKVMEVNVDQSVKVPNSKALSLPGTVIDEKQQLSMQFKATGRLNRGLSARGKVQIYNFTGQTLRLNVATTTLTAGSLIYRLEADVVGIKPTKYIKGTKDPDPSSLIPEVTVIAAQAGDNYNLPAGTRFEIKNEKLASTNQLYANNNQSLFGGSSRFSTIVTQEDIDNATAVLKASVLASAKQELFNTRGLVLLDSAFTEKDASSVFDKKTNDEAINFNGTVTSNIRALTYTAAELDKMVRERVEATLDSDKYLLNDSRTKTEVLFTQVDLVAGQGVLRITFQGFTSTKLDLAVLKESIRGKSKTEAQKTLTSIQGIHAAEVLLEPFWVNTVPRFVGNMAIEIKPANP